MNKIQAYTVKFLDGSINTVMTLKNGVKDGLYKEFFENGKRCKESFYVDGFLEGVHKEWYKNGNMSVLSYHTSKKGRHGPYNQWYHTGRLYIQTTYKNGLCEGEYNQWYYNGRLHIKTNYINGLKDGPYNEYHINGNSFITSTYKNGFLDGDYKEYYDNGVLNIDKKYGLYGKIQGEYKEFYASGSMKEKSYYIDDVIHGETIKWYEDGNLSHIMTYKMSKLYGKYLFFTKSHDIHVSCNYKNDLLHEEFIQIYTSGEKNIMNYDEGFLDGERKQYINGNLIISYYIKGCYVADITCRQRSYLVFFKNILKKIYRKKIATRMEGIMIPDIEWISAGYII